MALPRKAKLRLVGRALRHRRVRRRVRGTGERPRLSVFRSRKHIYAQLVDDTTGRVLAAACSLSGEVIGQAGEKRRGVEISRLVGKILASRAREKGVAKVTFDRGGYLYHGRVKAVAEGSREGGLQF